MSKMRKQGFSASRVSFAAYFSVRAVYFLVDFLALIPAILLAIISRFFPRPIDIGLGPLPTVNSPHHKRALERQGYSCETFVYYTWYFTQQFDVNIGRICPRALGPYVAYVWVLFRYRCLYTYFSGGPLGFTTILMRLEPLLYKIAGIKTVVMPFGADVHVLHRSHNLQMIDAYARDYPGMRHAIPRTEIMLDVWTSGADHIVSGCDWVDCMYYWDTLMLAHFAIDTAQFQPSTPPEKPGEICRPLRILHAPNHRNLKGTNRLVEAVERLRNDGVEIELRILEGVPNAEVPDAIRGVDIVVDQLVIGWYAMFALESMSLAKPVICHIEPRFRDLYVGSGLIETDELPLIDAHLTTIEATLRRMSTWTRGELHMVGERSRAFVERHHSLDAIGAKFAAINASIDIRTR